MIAERLAARAAALEAERVPFVQATVVRARRPASVRPGATALVLADGTIEGFVGGHCAEESVRMQALSALETGEALLLRIEPGTGEVDAIDGAITVHNPCISGGALEIFLEPRVPAPRLHVVGDTPIAMALCTLARTVGYDVAPHTGGDLGLARDDAAVIVASHGRDEERALETALTGGVPYVGLVASPKRGAAVTAEPRRDRGRPAAAPHPRGTEHRRALARGDRPVDPCRDRRHAAAGHGSRRRHDACGSHSARPTRATAAMSEPFVAGLVLAAGGSRRLGRPKQLLPYNGSTLLDHTVATARACEFDQLLVAVGGEADKVRSRVDLTGSDVVVNPGFGTGCSSSIAVAMEALDPATTVLVLMLGDQPGVVPATVRVLLAARGDAPIAVCRYEDGRGHPFAFGREVFDDLCGLHGDKAVWRMLDERANDVAEVPVAGRVPLDVDTWADYEAVVAAAGQA